MTEIPGNRTEVSGPEVPVDLQQTVESLMRALPDLADPEKLRLFNEALNELIATRDSLGRPAAGRGDAEAAKSRTSQAKRMTSVATALSGGMSAALITASVAPGAPELVVIGVGLLGLLASKYIAAGIDGLAERRTSRGRHLIHTRASSCSK